MSKSIFNKQSLIFLFIIGIVILISVSLLTYMNIKDQNDDHEFIQQTFQHTALMDNIFALVNESETLRRNYFLTGDKQNVSDIRENKVVMDSLLKQLRSNSFDDISQLANADALKPMVTERFALFNDGIEVQDQKGTNLKFHKNIFDKGKILNIDIKNLLNKMKKEEYKNLEEKKEISEQGSKFAFISFLAGIGASVLILSIAFVSLIKKASGSFALENQEITREELEQIVKERTAEISQINQKLYKKLSELEAMETKLKGSAEQYRKLFEQAHDAILIFSPEDQTVIDVNRRACDLYGFKREEFIGLSLKTLSKNVKQSLENLNLTLEKGYYHNFQSVHYKKEMTEMLMEINASVFIYNNKKVILSINRDITDRILKVPI